MKLLYIGSVFSGLESSLLSGAWAPTGVPTIYKMIEALDASIHEVRIVLTDRQTIPGFSEAWSRRRPVEADLEGLETPVTVLPHVPRPTTVFQRTWSKVAALRQLWWTVSAVRQFNPDVVYVDRANVVAGALVARFLHRPTVLRVMGVYPSMWETLRARGVAARLLKWAYRSPFAFALCTEDGTGGARWMDAALAPDVPRATMLNGVADAGDPDGPLPSAFAGLPKDRLVIMFIGRLEDIKGWREFVQGILSLSPEGREKVHAVVIGTGAGKAELERLIEVGNAESLFTLIDRIPHSQMQAAHKQADIYVSLNKLGNLSNANLECFADGMCVVMPTSDALTGADLSTDRLVPDDAAIRIDRDNMADALADTLDRLVKSPAEIRRRQAAMRALARRILVSWKVRAGNEMALLEHIAAGRDLARWTGASG